MTGRFKALLLLTALVGALSGCAVEPIHSNASSVSGSYDLIVRHGTVYDGSGSPGRNADVGIRGDRVAALGDLSEATAAVEIDATGRAVAPGFINVLSWANQSLIVDGRGMSDLK